LAQIFCVSYAQDLADKLSRDCRTILAATGTGSCSRRRGCRRSTRRCRSSKRPQSCRIATSVGGVLTGRGAGLIIIDDPLNPEKALSQAQC
jgi:hypothetical protein